MIGAVKAEYDTRREYFTVSEQDIQGRDSFREGLGTRRVRRRAEQSVRLSMLCRLKYIIVSRVWLACVIVADSHVQHRHRLYNFRFLNEVQYGQCYCDSL